MVDYIRFEKFFSIAFTIQEKGGVSVNMAKILIANEFDVVSNGAAVQREFEAMIKTKFISVGVLGVKANPKLEDEYKKFRWQKNMRGE